MMQGIKIGDCKWLASGRAREADAPIRSTDLAVRQLLLKGLLEWVLGYYVVKLVKTAFYITEHGKFGDRTFYFRQDVWEQATKPMLSKILNHQYEEIDNTENDKYILGASPIRLVPKTTGVRIITDMRVNNRKLKEAQHVLAYETKQQSNLIGSAIDGIQQLRQKLTEYKNRFSDNSGFYFVKADISKCFDTIRQDILLKLVRKSLCKREYILPKYGVLQQFTKSPVCLFQQDAVSLDELRPFPERAEKYAYKYRNAILVDNVTYKIRDLKQTWRLLEEHIKDNRIEGFHKAHVSQVYFADVNDIQTFCQVFKKGFPFFGAFANADKYDTNIDTEMKSQQTADLLTAEYKQHRKALNNLEMKLRQELETLGVEKDDLVHAQEYIKDHVTLFRFLRDSDFVEETAQKRLMDTIFWRISQDIHNMTWRSLANEFYDQGFAFFHKQDKLGRPIAVIRMRYFPKFRDKSLSEYMKPFACFVMEIARKLMWAQTCERNESFLVSQIAVIINIDKAPFVPVDAQLIGDLKEIVNERFPGSIGSVYVMNFGWMYQGIWQMVKLLLSDQAKSRVNFPSAKEIKELVEDEDLLQELGGADQFEWNIESDNVLQLYGCGRRVISPLPSPPIVPLTRPSRSGSMLSIVSSDDIFYDAADSLTFATPSTNFRSRSSSIYGTPGTLTPLPLPSCGSPCWPVSTQVVRTMQSPCHWTGLHLGAAFLTSFVNTRENNSKGVCAFALANRLAAIERDQITKFDDSDFYLEPSDALYEIRSEPHFPHLMPPAYANSPVKVHLIRSEQRLIRLTRHLFRLSFRYKGALYWVLLYIFLRGPVERSLHRALTRILATAPQAIEYTTIGITAAFAAAMSATMSSSLGHMERSEP
ncbi:hypothetical protein EC973_005297 [Apophysomyces ossiformis]|uniref:Telomerase reverse transcriptase n=1 Tax=Apophysomyces ossiformis TaxID=679940 RepID=A0A8H7BPG2_9FUNG|nr:hypothetical protein EC973_005297 [Apophysomyces ossiformis]